MGEDDLILAAEPVGESLPVQYKIPKSCPDDACAIVAINDSGKGFVMTLVGLLPDGLSDALGIDLPDWDFNEDPGLYYLEVIGAYCGGSSCSGRGECPGDCFEVELNVLGKATIEDLEVACSRIESE